MEDAVMKIDLRVTLSVEPANSFPLPGHKWRLADEIARVVRERLCDMAPELAGCYEDDVVTDVYDVRIQKMENVAT